MPTIPKSTRVGDAYERLKAEILRSDLPPGFQAPEPDIAERLGMSRTPVREALIRLESEGLVELVPRRGAKVLPLSIDDFLEIYELLVALEPAALEKLAGMPVGVQDLEELETLNEEMEKAGEAGDLDAWASADDRFHRKLLRLSSNGRLVSYAECLLDQAHRGRLLLLHLHKKPIGAAQEHRDILAAVLSGDSAAAADLARRHRMAAKTTFLEIFSSSRLNHI
jgi:DNA-binding GntR family transcriptional regulator